MKPDDSAIYALVSDPEINAAAMAIAFRMGRLYGAALPKDKKMLREAAKAGLYAAARVRILRRENNLHPPLDGPRRVE